MYTIVRRELFSENSFLWEVLAPDVAAAAQPGHFIMLRLHENGERIPLTVADFDRERGTVTIVVQALGKTTREMRDRYAEGDSFDDFVAIKDAHHGIDAGSPLEHFGAVALDDWTIFRVTGAALEKLADMP